ncbi:MAG: hypothetical protein KatS3mg015_1501 [Fimbriimonadales bacterium]|nr:MAG: hypothetical protein KatS3mg015_1501 [Fimbriimonadales bacterium]
MSEPILNPKVQELVHGTQVAPQRSATQPKPAQGEKTFSQVLEEQQGLRLSGHAATRLKSRNIQIGAEDWERIREGVDRAASKGSRESLILMNDVALVVSVKNRTVITAVAKEQLRENVFTNIDSAVIL